MKKLALILSIFYSASCAEATTYISTGSNTILLQYTEVRGNILGKMYFSSDLYKTYIKSVTFDIDGIKNLNDLSLKMTETSGYSSNIYGKINGRFLDLNFNGKIVRLRPGTFEEYNTYVSKLKLAADSLNSQAKKIQQQQNDANAASNRIRAVQAKALQPYLSQVQVAFKNLRSVEDNIGALIESDEIIDGNLDYKTIRSALDYAKLTIDTKQNTNAGCINFKSLRMDILENVIETANDLSRAVPSSYKSLSDQLIKTEDALSIYRIKLKLNPKSGLEGMSNTTKNAHQVLDTLNRMNTKLTYMSSAYPNMIAEFQKLNTLYTSLQPRCDDGY